MANTTFVKANRLAQEAAQSRKKALLFGLPVTGFLIFTFPVVWWWFLAAYGIIVFNAGIIKRAGAKGEDKTLQLLKELPDTYTVFNQLDIPDTTSKTGFIELDFIVAGPNGLFVVEVKNNKGRIVGHESDRKWVAHKVGRQGTHYQASLGNPVKQVKRQIWALSNYMKDQNQRAWVEGLIFFSNPASKLQLKDNPSVPVLHKNGLVEHILQHQPRHRLKNSEAVATALAKLRGLV